MSSNESLVILFNRFGNKPFWVRDMDDGEVDDLAVLLDIFRDRSSLGRWLSGNDGLESSLLLGRDRLKLVVLEPSDDSRAGVYQIKSVIGR